MNPTEIIAADIGGTNARYAIATIEGQKVTHLTPPITFLTAAHASLAASWAAFAQAVGRPLPRAAAIAVACPLAGDVLAFTNNPWVLRRSTLAAELNLGSLTLVNDFGAMGHALSQLKETDFLHLTGPESGLPETGAITLLGPGTGLGAALVLRHAGQSHVVATEAGHQDFAPLDPVEDAILAHLRARFTRVSVERLISGPGLVNIFEALAAIDNHPSTPTDDKSLWNDAIGEKSPLATAALFRFCQILGAAAGDLALAHGAAALVLTGGIAPRIAKFLSTSGFAARFSAKGRLQPQLAKIPVKLLAHPHPGLLGAAAAFAQER
jgi:glucokinase